MKPHSTDRPARKNGAAQAVLTLFRVGGRRCRLAAALVAVMVGLMGQTATQAFGQAKETVLYLDAPAVSTDRATRAGETASAYSDPRSPASPDALAWLGVQGPRGDKTEAPPQDASGAFTSVTASDARGTPGITAEAAYDAGATMLAQIEDGAPPEDGVPGEDELAATGAVRPELGEGTQAPDEEPSAGYEAAPAEQPATPGLASSSERVVPVSEPVQEPSGGEGLALEAPAPTEFAAVPTDDASPAPEISPDTEPDYDATGPISEPAAEPAPTAESSTEPEIQEAEIQEAEIQEPVSPSGGDEAAVLETMDSPEPGASPASSGEASASPEPAVEPYTAPTAERAEEPEGGDEEFAGANTKLVADPEPAEETAHGDPAYGDPSAAPDTGPTRDQGDVVALAPTSSPAPEDDGGSDDPDSASPASEEAGQGDASENVSGGQVSEVVVVQESDTGEEADPAASPPPDFAPPIDEAENNGAEDTGPPSWAPPSDETQPGTAPTAKPLAEQSADDGAQEAYAPPPEAPSEQSPEQTAPGSGETATSSPADGAEEPAPDSSHGTGPDGEGTAGVPDSPPPEEASPSGETPPTGEDQEDGQDTPPQDPGSGEAPTGGSASPGGTPSGDPQAPPDNTEQALSPGGNAGTNGPRPHAHSPAGSSNQGPDRSREGRKNDSRDRRDRGHSGAGSSNERLRRIRQGDGGAETVQEKAREATGRFGITGRADKEPTPREQRSRGADAGSPEDAGEEEVSEDSQAQNYVLRTVGSAQGSGVGDQVDSAGAHEPATASPEQAGNGSRPEPFAEQQAAKLAERREARQAERFAAPRVAERKADRRASRVAAREQAAVERVAVREQRRQNRPTDGESFDAQGYVAPSTGRRRNVPDHQETVPQPAIVELAPVRQVKTQRFAPVEQPAAVELSPARQVPAARLAPAAQVQPQATPQVRQQLGSGGVGQVGGGGVARVTKSVNLADGH